MKIKMSKKIGYTDTTIVYIATGFTYSSFNTGNIISHDIITRKQLRSFCENIEITKEIFEDIEERIPMGADLLTELIKIEQTNHPYVKKLIRIRKLNRIL